MDSDTHYCELDVCVTLQSKSRSQHSIFLSLQKSDETKNAELFLLNLAQDLLDIPPSNHASFADSVNAIFDMAKRIAESGACRTLVEIGYTITAFVEFGNSIANVSNFELFTGKVLTLAGPFTGNSICEIGVVLNYSVFKGGRTFSKYRA